STSFTKLVIQCVAYWLTSWPELEYTIFNKKYASTFFKKIKTTSTLVIQYGSADNDTPFLR
ncbi:hypothetical protein, partial [Paenibacillus gallinarum]|uniref:hypothetical protein n=1 Tax=Paenibacillus gallinarum TaxID=2762232 RepID=UPI001CD8C2E5